MNLLRKRWAKFNKVVRFIWNHPLSSRSRFRYFKKFFLWQLSQTFYPHPVEVRFVEDSRLLVEKGMVGATGNIYTGLADFEDMSFLLHVLRPKDIFADVGANVGVYTVLASKNAGAESYTFEPVPSTFERLKKNIETNGITGKVHLYQNGVGAKKGKLSFTSSMDSINHVIPDGRNDVGIKVDIITLDEAFQAITPVLIKIDVEGFEWEVLHGAPNILNSRGLKAIIIELNGSGEFYGHPDAEVHSFITDFGFHPFKYVPFKRELIAVNSFGNVNTLYIKDIDWVRERIASARYFKVAKQKI